jgi:hypothetical protein
VVYVASATLPVGTYVLVRDPGLFELDRWTGRYAIDPREFYAIVRGYDMGHSKYQVGARLPGWGRWLFADGGRWVFPSWCTEVTEEEAMFIPGRPA